FGATKRKKTIPRAPVPGKRPVRSLLQETGARFTIWNRRLRRNRVRESKRVEHDLAGRDESVVNRGFYFELKQIVNLRELRRPQNDAVARAHRLKKFHGANSRKQKTRLAVF